MPKKYKKVVILDSVILYPEHRRRLENLAEEIVEYNTCNTEDEVLERTKGADCVISCWVDIPNKVIDLNPQLKTIAFWTHAYEHRIDKKYAEAHGIFVPCIPDYGTDSVAELALGGLLELYGDEEKSFMPKTEKRTLVESVADQIFNDVRRFKRNVKDNLKGVWLHEYIKEGKLKYTNEKDLPEETMKGLTVGAFISKGFDIEILKMLSRGFCMNAIACYSDFPHELDIAFRPVEKLLAESQVIIYDSADIEPEVEKAILSGNYLSVVDLQKVNKFGRSIIGKKLGIVGLGRIGSRVAQIANDAFKMDVHYFSRRNDVSSVYNTPVKWTSMDEILTQSDIITFHLPHVGAERFITDEMIEKIPNGTTIINVSVGNIFNDQKVLLDRFARKELNGYLDVYATLPPRAVLRENKDVLLSTYRLGWRTKTTIGLKTHKLLTKLENGKN